MPEISRRAGSLGTENAFVVLAEVNALARQGKDIVSFCIGQPDFPAPDNVQEAAIRAIKGGKHGYTPSAGIDELRQAAAQYLASMRGGLPIRAEDVVVGAGAKPFIAYAILSTTDHGAGDEVIYPNPGFPIYESQIVANGAKPVPIHLHESRGFSFDPQELERLITPQDAAADPQLPAQPDRGLSHPQRAGNDRRGAEKASRRCGSTPTRSIRASCSRASSSPSRRCRGCTSAPSSPTAPRRPGR